MDSIYKAPAELRRYQAFALAIGVLGVVLLIVGNLVGHNPGQVYRSFMIGYIFWVGVSVGSLGLLCLQYITGGFWGVASRRILEASSRGLLPMAILFPVIVFGLKNIYLWAQPGIIGVDKIIEKKAAYLNPEGFWMRGIAYFAIWGLIAYLFSKWSRKQDEQGNHGLSLWMSRFGGPALIFLILAVSFAAIDWVLSMDPHWSSTIFGLIFVASWGLTALAFTIAVMAWLSGRAPMKEFYGAPHFHDLGKLMLALTMLWAYFSFSQFILVWSANLPEETGWYITRMSNGWGFVGAIVVILHFALPFLVLLNRGIKKKPNTLVLVAVWLLVMRVVDLFWLIAPTYVFTNGGHATSVFHLSWMDVVAPVAVGGLWMAFFCWTLASRPLLPVNDPNFVRSEAHGKKGDHEHLIEFSEG
jgi:hypothetical protein